MSRGPEQMNPNRVSTLVQALAEKGTPGIILLGIIFLYIWAPVGIIAFRFFDLVGLAKDLLAIPLAGPLTMLVVALFGAGYLWLAYRITAKILGMMIPTIRAEAEAAVLLAEAFGGPSITKTGLPTRVAIDPHRATVRTKQIMRALLEQARNVLGFELVRCNIFTLREDHKLKIAGDFHINMKGGTPDNQELTIAIPNGYLSSGRAYKYSRPILSVKGKDGSWPYAYDLNSFAPELQTEVSKAHPDLVWIVSMPIPYQVKPFELVSGVLNVDGLEGQPTTKELQALLADQSTAAALIGVLNRNTGFLHGEYSIPSEPSDADKEQLRGHLIDPEIFDPASCPEPSIEFVQALSNIGGLEFLQRISPAEVASFLREQLSA